MVGFVVPNGFKNRWQKHIAVPAIAESRKLFTLGSNITLLLLTLVGVATEGLGPEGGAWPATSVEPEDPLAGPETGCPQAAAAEAVTTTPAVEALAYIMNELNACCTLYTIFFSLSFLSVSLLFCIIWQGPVPLVD